MAAGDDGAELGNFTMTPELSSAWLGAERLGKSLSCLIVGISRPGSEIWAFLDCLTGVFSKTKGSSSPGWGGGSTITTRRFSLLKPLGVGGWVPLILNAALLREFKAVSLSLLGVIGLAAFNEFFVFLLDTVGNELLLLTLTFPHTFGRVLVWALADSLLALIFSA